MSDWKILKIIMIKKRKIIFGSSHTLGWVKCKTNGDEGEVKQGMKSKMTSTVLSNLSANQRAEKKQ